MKYIFDFDDVLFHTTKQFKEHMYKCLEDEGVGRVLAETHFKKLKEGTGRVQELLRYFSLSPDLYGKILNQSKNFVNNKVVTLIKKLGKTNCYIVTFGQEDFQLDKIKQAGIADLFSEIIVVPFSKKEAIEKIAEKYPNEEIFFIDDKQHHFDNLDFSKYPNINTILYTGQDLEHYFQ